MPGIVKPRLINGNMARVGPCWRLTDTTAPPLISSEPVDELAGEPPSESVDESGVGSAGKPRVKPMDESIVEPVNDLGEPIESSPGILVSRGKLAVVSVPMYVCPLGELEE